MQLQFVNLPNNRQVIKCRWGPPCWLVGWLVYSRHRSSRGDRAFRSWWTLALHLTNGPYLHTHTHTHTHRERKSFIENNFGPLSPHPHPRLFLTPPQKVFDKLWKKKEKGRKNVSFSFCFYNIQFWHITHCRISIRITRIPTEFVAHGMLLLRHKMQPID